MRYTLKQAQELVDDAVRRSQPRHERWDSLERLYRYGSPSPDVSLTSVEAGRLAESVGLSLDSINLALPAVNIILESVVARTPGLLVEPLSGGENAEVSAKVAQAVARYFWRRSRATYKLRDNAQDMVVLGSGFAKVGWAHEEHDEERPEDEILDEVAKQIEADRTLATLSGRAPTDPDEIIQRVALTTSVVDVDEPYVEYVSPFDMFVPLDARRLEEARWVAQRLTLPADEVRAHPEYENTEHVKVDGRAGAESSQRGGQARRGKDGVEAPGTDAGTGVFETATIYEFYDMRSRRLMVFQLDAKAPLLDRELPYSHRYTPFVHARNYSDGGKEFWPFGELESVASIFHMYNEFTQEQLDNARRSGNKYVVNADRFTPELRELLESSEPDVVVPVPGLGDESSIGDIFQAVPREPLPADVYEAAGMLHGLSREVMGLNDFQTGGVGADRMSATAAAVVDGVATLRAQGKVQQVEECASQIAGRQLLLCQEFLTEATAIRIVGDQGVAWEDVTADDIHGEFMVTVEGGSTQAVNPATRQQRATDMLTTIIPTIQALGYDPEPALRSVLRDLEMDPDIVLVRPEGAALPDGPPGAPPMPGGPSDPTVPQEGYGGPPVPAAVRGDIAL